MFLADEAVAAGEAISWLERSPFSWLYLAVGVGWWALCAAHTYWAGDWREHPKKTRQENLARAVLYAILGVLYTVLGYMR